VTIDGKSLSCRVWPPKVWLAELPGAATEPAGPRLTLQAMQHNRPPDAKQRCLTDARPIPIATQEGKAVTWTQTCDPIRM
jgi:hypothetical protein